MLNFGNKRILILQQRSWGINIGHFLAIKLQSEGAKLCALTLKKTTHEFIISQKEVRYDLIINNDEVMENPKKYLDKDEFTIKEICQDLGIDSIWPIVSSLRNHVKSYQEKYYYSYKQNISDSEIEDYIKAIYKTIKNIFNNFNPDLIISPNFVSLPHIMINLYALKNQIPMIGVTDSKVKGYNIFINDYLENSGLFFQKIEKLNNHKEDSKNRTRAREYIEEFRNKFKQPDHLEKFIKDREDWRQKIKKELAPFYRILQWYIDRPKDSLANLGPTIDYRSPKIILRDHFCHKQYERYAKKFNYYPFEKIKKFVYFPLQFQPESSIDVMAPYFSNQIETARLIAMSLPDDYTLVVKEHPAMVGLRTPSYLEKLSRTVNIKLIDYRTSSQEVLKRTDLIISPNSTTIVEAAFFKKPAIQLGNLGTTLRLPNVFKHTDLTTLTKKIKTVLTTNLDTADYEEKLENFVIAAFETGFNIKYTDIWEGNNKNSREMEDIWNIYKSAIEYSIKK